jgi:hypothetical protein
VTESGAERASERKEEKIKDSFRIVSERKAFSFESKGRRKKEKEEEEEERERSKENDDLRKK